MISTIIGLFALIVGKLRISKYYGLEGAGARVAGLIILILGLAIPRLIGKPLVSLCRSLGFGPTGVLITLLVMSIATIWIIIVLLVKHFGNAYAKDEE